MKTVTFYSYKGGVGRTLALAWVARDLAARGKVVVAMDLDLEAPGLHYKLRPESGANPQAGFVDLAARFVRGDAPPASLMDYLLQVQSGLWLMPAGNAPSAVYWREWAAVPWTSFLAESDLGIRFMHEIKARLLEELKPDFLLIDARTGITELGSAAVALLSDAVVCLTTSAPESKEGLRSVMRSIAATARADGRQVPAWIPVLSRVPPEVSPDAVANSLASFRDYVQEPTDDLAATVAVDGVLVLTSDHEVQFSEATALLVGRDARLTEDYRRLAQAVELGLVNVPATPRTPLGRRFIATSHEAVELLRSDVEDYRRRAASGQEGDVLVLLQGLRQLERALADAGQLDAALAASQELVARCRQLASTRPDAFLLELPRSLNNLGVRLSELGQHEAALAAVQEAVTIYRELALARAAEFLPILAASLNNLGGMLRALGQHDAALAAVQEAVTILRRLSEVRPEEFLPYSAGSVHNLGGLLRQLGRREAALAALQDAVALYRRLSHSRPDAFLPDLAMSLNNLGALLSELGQREAALAATQETVALSIQLTEARPDVFQERLLSRLRNLIARLGEAQQPVETDATVRAAIELLARLGALPPDSSGA